MRKIINHHIERGTQESNHCVQDLCPRFANLGHLNLGHFDGIPKSLPQYDVRFYYSQS